MMSNVSFFLLVARVMAPQCVFLYVRKLCKCSITGRCMQATFEAIDICFFYLYICRRHMNLIDSPNDDIPLLFYCSLSVFPASEESIICYRVMPFLWFPLLVLIYTVSVMTSHCFLLLFSPLSPQEARRHGYDLTAWLFVLLKRGNDFISPLTAVDVGNAVLFL